MCKRKCNKHRVIAGPPPRSPTGQLFDLSVKTERLLAALVGSFRAVMVCFLQLRKLCRHCRVAACQPLYRHVLCLVVGETEITVCTEQGISLERIEFLLEVCDVAVRAFDFAHSYTSSLVASSP